MFKVTNKLDVNLQANGLEIVNELKKLNVPVSKTKYAEGSNIAEYDFIDLAEKLEKASSINYIAPANLSLKPFTVEEQKELQRNGLKVESFYKFFARRNLGFYNLLPGESATIEHNPEIIEDLISKSFALNITIEDTEADDIVYDGGTIKTKSTEIGYDELGKKTQLITEVETLTNLLHPDSKNELYYSPKKKNEK